MHFCFVGLGWGKDRGKKERREGECVCVCVHAYVLVHLPCVYVFFNKFSVKSCGNRKKLPLLNILVNVFQKRIPPCLPEHSRSHLSLVPQIPWWQSCWTKNTTFTWHINPQTYSWVSMQKQKTKKLHWRLIFNVCFIHLYEFVKSFCFCVTSWIESSNQKWTCYGKISFKSATSTLYNSNGAWSAAMINQPGAV